MAYRYRRSRNDFFLFGSANEIRETEHGSAAGGHIYYPGVSTCTTITLLLADGTGIGMHLAKPDLSTDVDAVVTELDNVRAGRAVHAMFAVGVLRCRGTDGWMAEARYRWPVQLTTFNTAFGRPAGALVSGYIQPEGTDKDYRVLIAAGPSAAFFMRDVGTPTWSPLALESL